jgi:hypothetical protein
MRTLIVCFFAAEDGAPIDGSAMLMAGRWRTGVAAKQKPLHGGPEVRFEIEDATVVNEVLVTAPRRFPRFVPWPKADVLDVRLEKAGELIVAANRDDMRFVQVHAAAGQATTDFLRGMDKDFRAIRCGQSLNCGAVLPGQYTIDVFDEAKKPVAQLTVDLPAWRTTFIEAP